jgi:3-oxoacyl-[acyl-carrier protein] reductase
MIVAKKPGAIVNIASVLGFGVSKGTASYAVAKAAVVQTTKALSVELAFRGIRVNAIAPGWIEVENHWRRFEGYDPIAGGKRLPSQRVGQPADIGRVAVFLASDDAAFMVGQTVIVDGGQVAMMNNMALDIGQ